MKKFWMALMVAIMGVTVVVSSAEAKRLGGGGSFGKSSPSYSRQAPAQSPGSRLLRRARHHLPPHLPALGAGSLAAPCWDSGWVRCFPTLVLVVNLPA